MSTPVLNPTWAFCCQNHRYLRVSLWNFVKQIKRWEVWQITACRCFRSEREYNQGESVETPGGESNWRKPWNSTRPPHKADSLIAIFSYNLWPMIELFYRNSDTADNIHTLGLGVVELWNWHDTRLHYSVVSRRHSSDAVRVVLAPLNDLKFIFGTKTAVDVSALCFSGEKNDKICRQEKNAMKYRLS